MAAGCNRSFGSLKGWNKVESGFKSFQFAIDGARKPRNHRAALGPRLLGSSRYFYRSLCCPGASVIPMYASISIWKAGRSLAPGKRQGSRHTVSNALEWTELAEADYALAQTYLHLGAFSAAYGELQKRTVGAKESRWAAQTRGLPRVPRRYDDGLAFLPGKDGRSSFPSTAAAQPPRQP